MREPQVVGMPSMSRTSLIATGTPARAGAGRPSASARSTARAFSSARSSRTSRYASTLPSTAFKRARWAFATSSADTSRATTFRRISEADSSWRALIRRGPEARGRGRPWDRERSRGRGPGRGPPAEHPPGRCQRSTRGSSAPRRRCPGTGSTPRIRGAGPLRTPARPDPRIRGVDPVPGHRRRGADEPRVDRRHLPGGCSAGGPRPGPRPRERSRSQGRPLPRASGPRRMSALHELSASDIRRKVVAREVSAEEVAKAHLARLKAVEGKVDAYLLVLEDRALEKARAVDRALAEGRPAPALAGVPVAIKDVLDIEGLPTTCGSRILERYPPPFTATAVARLEAAGALVLGKTNMDEFAMGSSTENSAYKKTKNPWDVTRVPGGSSGGSAAAVAARTAPLAL